MGLEQLIGKSMLEVVTALPEFSWSLRENGRVTPDVKLRTLTFVYYKWKNPAEPAEYDDIFRQVDVSKGVQESDLSFAKEEKERGVGLISKVELGLPSGEYERRHAHIPMLDLDTEENFSFMNESELVELLKRSIRETTEMRKGVILKSGTKKNYFFVGIGELLGEQEFVTFLGLSLLMRFKKLDGTMPNLVHAAHIGHSLARVKYVGIEKTQNPGSDRSYYDYAERFSTLRVNTKPRYSECPKVVDVLDSAIVTKSL